MIILPLFGILFGLVYCATTKTAGAGVFMGIVIGTIGAYVGCILGNILLLSGGLLQANVFSLFAIMVVGISGISVIRKLPYRMI